VHIQTQRYQNICRLITAVLKQFKFDFENISEQIRVHVCLPLVEKGHILIVSCVQMLHDFKLIFTIYW
jgi:hypothetical protein